MNSTFTSKFLPWLVALYTMAGLLHFTHNAEFLDEYPNLPSWISRSGVYIAWLGIAAVGACGYVLYRAGQQATGLCVLAVYACLGFDGLLHYQRAPFSAHTATMNATILFEATAAAVLLIVLIQRVFELRRPRLA